MPQRPPPPNPPPPVCFAHGVAGRGDCPECERELRNAKRFMVAMLVLLVTFVVALAVQASGG